MFFLFISSKTPVFCASPDQSCRSDQSFATPGSASCFVRVNLCLYYIYIYITYILYQISSKFEPRPCVSWWFLRQSLFREKKVDGSIQTPEPRPSLDPRYLSGQKNCLGYLVIVWKNQSCYLSRTKLSLKHPLNTSSIYLESWIEISQTTIWRCSQLRISDTCIPDPCVYCMYSWRILCC